MLASNRPAAFPDEQACIRHFRAVRWANGPFCPYCGGTKIYHFSDDRTHKCGDCRQRFSIKVGTIFEDTKLPLRKWFIAIWLITSHKKGIASTQLARNIGVTQKTAWFMTHRLREAAATKSFNKPLAGEIEIDETFVGGKERNKHEWQRQHAGTGGVGKTAVFGMLERGGELRAMKVDDLRARTVQGKVVENVTAGANIMSDEFPELHRARRPVPPPHGQSFDRRVCPEIIFATSTDWKAHGRNSSGRCSASTIGSAPNTLIAISPSSRGDIIAARQRKAIESTRFSPQPMARG
jgi:transposase-like protein